MVPQKIKCEEEITLNVGRQCEFVVEILPENAKNKEFRIENKDANIIQCIDGEVIAINPGES